MKQLIIMLEESCPKSRPMCHITPTVILKFSVQTQNYLRQKANLKSQKVYISKQISKISKSSKKCTLLTKEPKTRRFFGQVFHQIGHTGSMAFFTFREFISTNDYY